MLFFQVKVDKAKVFLETKYLFILNLSFQHSNGLVQVIHEVHMVRGPHALSIVWTSWPSPLEFWKNRFKVHIFWEICCNLPKVVAKWLGPNNFLAATKMVSFFLNVSCKKATIFSAENFFGSFYFVTAIVVFSSVKTLGRLSQVFVTFS